MKRQQLPGFTYDGKRKRAIFDGFVPGTKCKVRRQRTIEDVTRDQALEAWKEFRAELASGRAIRGPLTLRQFVEGYYELIAASHAPGTRKTQGMIIKNHLLRYFGDRRKSGRGRMDCGRCPRTTTCSPRSRTRFCPIGARS